MEHLSLRNIPCPLPIRGFDGESKRYLGKNPAAIVSFLEGKARSRITPEECVEVGRALASLHMAGKDFKKTRQNDLSLSGWRSLLNSCHNKTDALFPGLETVLISELEFLELNWPRSLPQSVIHADLFPDNVFFNGDKLCGIIDFYFACNDFAAYDLAICLNAWCFESNNMSFNITKSRALLDNYQQRRTLTKEERHALPILSRGACLRFILTRLFDYLNQIEGALVKPKDPFDYVARLKFHQQVSHVTTYGISE
jgi:homoserine kinase type II